MKKIIVLLLFLLSGCDITVYSWELKQTIKFCSDKGGISYMKATNTNVGIHVTCLSSEHIALSEK